MCGVVAVLPAPAPTRARDLSYLVQTLESLRIPVLAGRAGEIPALTQLQASLVSANCLLSDPAAELATVDQLLVHEAAAVSHHSPGTCRKECRTSAGLPHGQGERHTA